MRCFMDKLILIKYGELTTKKNNRLVFVKNVVEEYNNTQKDAEKEAEEYL